MAKLGVFGGIVAGVAVVVMPLASTDAVEPFDVTAVRVTEIQSMNFPFDALAIPLGIGDSTSAASVTNSFSGIDRNDVNSQFFTVVYGAGETSVGSAFFGPCNDTATQSVAGDNVQLIAMLNGGGPIDVESAAGYLFGSDAALAVDLPDSMWDYAEKCFCSAVSDTGDYFAIEL